MARAAEMAGGSPQPIAIDPLVLEVAPTQDTFVPFEVPTMEIASGWYRLECQIVVDGIPMLVHPGEPFPIPWPRSVVRRGTVAIGKKAGGVSLETLECVADRVRLVFAADEVPSPAMQVDGESHPIVAVEFDEDGGPGAGAGLSGAADPRTAVGHAARRAAGRHPAAVTLAPARSAGRVGGAGLSSRGARHGPRRGVPAALRGMRRRSVALLRTLPRPAHPAVASLVPPVRPSGRDRRFPTAPTAHRRRCRRRARRSSTTARHARPSTG